MSVSVNRFPAKGVCTVRNSAGSSRFGKAPCRSPTSRCELRCNAGKWVDQIGLAKQLPLHEVDSPEKKKETIEADCQRTITKRRTVLFENKPRVERSAITIAMYPIPRAKS